MYSIDAELRSAERDLMVKKRGMEAHVSMRLPPLDETKNAPLGTYFKEPLIDEIIKKVRLEIAGGSSKERLWRDLEALGYALRHYEESDQHPTLKQQQENLQEISTTLNNTQIRLKKLLNPDPGSGKLSFFFDRALRLGKRTSPELDYLDTINNLFEGMTALAGWGTTALNDEGLGLASWDTAHDAALEQLGKIYKHTFDEEPSVNSAEASLTGGAFVVFVSLCLNELLTHKVSTEKGTPIMSWIRHNNKKKK